MFTQVKQYIEKRIQIPDKDLEESLQYSTLRYFKKGDYILKIGDYCRFIGFLNSGLIMNTIIDEGKEIACNFIFENCFFTYTEGITNNAPSHKNSIALEDCEMLVLEKDKLPLIFSINQKFETLFTQILAEEVRNLLLNEERTRTQSIEKRYLQFIETFPEAFNRIPQKYIAGYLGIEPPSLSRLRKRLARK
ncbi:MAG TPA: Crp/Fnr family transcriptional regulator [Chitinophagaceae bacterium]|jgi:CRP-like cAMP-binding protein|nr:Crp/Fnr family transcriptional regulator [Chitinophagaceae bacterium]